MAKVDYSMYGVPEEEYKTNNQGNGAPSNNKDLIPSSGRGFLKMGAFGVGDLVSGFVGAAGANLARPDLFEDQSFNDLVQEGQNLDKARYDKAEQDNPLSYTAGQMASGISSAAGLAAVSPKLFGLNLEGLNFAGKAAQLAKVGATTGAYTGAIDTEGSLNDKASAAASQAAVGAVASPVVGIAGERLFKSSANIFNRIMGRNILPETKDLASNPAEEVFLRQNINRDDLLQNVGAARSAQQEAANRGITLTTPESFKDPNLLAQQAVLRDKPGAGSVKAANLRNIRQEQQLPKAFEDQIRQISSVSSPDKAGRMLQEGAAEVEKGARQEIKSLSKPFYDKAFYIKDADGNLQPKMLNDATKKYTIPANYKDPMRSYARDVVEGGDTYNKFAKSSVFKSFANETKDDPVYQDMPKESLPFLDGVRSKILSGMRDLERGGNKNSAEWRKMNVIQGRIKNTIDDNLDPIGLDNLKQARNIYSEGSPELEKMLEGRIGALKNIKDVNAYKAPEQLIKGSAEQTREAVSKLSRNTIRAGAAGIMRNAEYDARGQAFDSIQKKIFNTRKQQEQFRSMLGEKYEPFAKLMDVFSRVGEGQRYLQGSVTQPKLEASKEFSKKIADLADDAAHNKVGLARTIIGWVSGKSPELKNAEEAKFYSDMADVILTDRGIALMENLASMKPSIKQAEGIMKSFLQGTTSSSAIGSSKMVKGSKEEQLQGYKSNGEDLSMYGVLEN